ncbi:hypothetical protein GTN66_04925 [bacterium]|nr:hypothetical protein [bacterium]NIN91609.1 hypothetical protein [bacterium]NIO17973.1 hypothetical protein [bacterium]NIO73741.1 hypothetical protein [bacterium]
MGKAQLAIPSPYPVKAGEKLTFQVILINTGTEKWIAEEYSLRAEIYDAQKNYLTRTDSIKGRVEVEAGGTVSLYIPFRVPGNYSGTYYWRISLSYLKETIFSSDYYDFSVIPITVAPEAPLPFKIGGNFITSYENSSREKWEDYTGNINLNLIGRFFDRAFSLNVYTYHTVEDKFDLDTILFNYYSPLFTLSAGDIMPGFSHLTLYGLGALGGAIVTEGKFSTGLVVARSEEAVKGSTSTDGTFSRYVYGIQERVELPKNFAVNTSYVFSDDNEKSLDWDKGEWGPSLAPVRNGVWGMSVNWESGGGIELNGEYAYSNYWEEPKGAAKEKFRDYGFKFESSLEREKFSFEAAYERIEPHFFSLASPEVTNDRAGYELLTGYQGISFANLSLGFNEYRDNLAGDPSEVTSTQSILTGVLDFDIDKLPDMIIGYSLNLMLGKPRSALENNTQTFSLGLSHSLGSISLYSSGQLSNFRDKTDSSNDLSTLTGSFSLTSGLAQAISITSGITLTRTRDLDDKSIDKSQSYSLSVNWGVIPQRFTVSTWGTVIVAKSNDLLVPADNITTNASLEFSYSFMTGLTLNLGYELDAYRDDEDSSNNYEGHGFITRLSYSF